MDNNVRELIEASKPLIAYLEKRNPYVSVIVNCRGVREVSVDMFIPALEESVEE